MCGRRILFCLQIGERNFFNFSLSQPLRSNRTNLRGCAILNLVLPVNKNFTENLRISPLSLEFPDRKKRKMKKISDSEPKQTD